MVVALMPLSLLLVNHFTPEVSQLLLLCKPRHKIHIISGIFAKNEVIPDNESLKIIRLYKKIKQ